MRGTRGRMRPRAWLASTMTPTFQGALAQREELSPGGYHAFVPGRPLQRARTSVTSAASTSSCIITHEGHSVRA